MFVRYVMLMCLSFDRIGHADPISCRTEQLDTNT